MSDRVTVRDAAASDLDVLVGFNLAMARETEGKDLDPATLRAGMAALLGDASRGRTFVLEADGAPAATLMLTAEWSDWRNGWFWWIQNVYVRPADRGRGFYRRLHEHVCALAAERADVYGLRLYVESENRAARATYLAMGMEETRYVLCEQMTRKR